MLKFETTARFKRDIKRVQKRRYDLSLMDTVVQLLIEQKPLGQRYHDHELKGEYTGFRECHIKPDWLLIYRIDGERLVLVASRTGSHADLL